MEKTKQKEAKTANMMNRSRSGQRGGTKDTSGRGK